MNSVELMYANGLHPTIKLYCASQYHFRGYDGYRHMIIRDLKGLAE